MARFLKLIYFYFYIFKETNGHARQLSAREEKHASKEFPDFDYKYDKKVINWSFKG